jgi:large subunit ribosomal protein L5
MSYTPRLKEKYRNEIKQTLQERFNYKSVMSVPKLEKIVLSQGMGDAVADKKLIDSAAADLSRIAGQKAITTISKKDISNFKLRKGMPIGTKVTLRGDRMYDFLDRLLSVALPRTRDFRGINPKGFDGRGNFNLGIKEHIIFPEIDIDKVNRISGMDITFVTTARTNEEAYELLKEMGMPFKNVKKETN